MDKGFYISTDKTKLNIDFIHNYLSVQSYWAKGRSLELVEKSIENSLCFGVYNSSDEQIAFARVATDYVVFAWLMDVFVDTPYSGKSIGKTLIQYIVNHPELKVVNGIGLRTKDAKEFYSRYDFKEIPQPQTWMFRKQKSS